MPESQTIEAWQEVEHNLPNDQCEMLRKLAVHSPDAEVCGFLLEDMTICPIDNVDASPLYGFTMDQDQMMKVVNNFKILAVYHSHPSNKHQPSVGDSEIMAYYYQQGCPWRYLIVTGGGVYEYRHKDRPV